MPKKKDAAAELAEHMLPVLEAQRRLGPGAYPLALKRLAELTDPAAPDDLVFKAIKKKPFAGHVILVQPKDLTSPVALAADTPILVASSKLLEFVLNQVCTPDQPAVGISKLKMKVPTKLRPSFEAALQRHVEENTLPPTVAVVTDKKKKLLHLVRYPLPRPPEVVLAERLIQELGTQRRNGDDAYPLALDRLFELTQPDADSALRKKVLAQPDFKQQVVLALKDRPDTPVALAEDGERLASSPLLLHAVLHCARTDSDQAFNVATLEKKLTPSLRAPFKQALGRRIESRSLPTGVCLLRHKTHPILFLLSEVESQNGRPTVPEVRLFVPATSDFARDFDTAFERLNRQRGNHNLVCLVDLRRDVPCDRGAFDAGLRQLRADGRYTLKLAEGRHGVSPAEQEAAIQEDGKMLLYVSRKLS